MSINGHQVNIGVKILTLVTVHRNKRSWEMMIRYEFGARVDTGPFLERQKEWKRGPVCNTGATEFKWQSSCGAYWREKKKKLLQSFQLLREAIQKSTNRKQ